MAFAVDAKDPSEVLDYGVNWTDELGGDSILSHNWAVSEGDVTLGVKSIETADGETFAKVWVSGGTAGTIAILTSTITTAGGRTFEQSIKIRVVQK